VLRVSYLELRAAPAPAPERAGPETIARERLTAAAYLDLYRRVGAAVRWDQRSNMPYEALAALLEGERLHIYVLRGAQREALGLCEFDRGGFPELELKNFGLVPEVQGRGLGQWLLSVALNAEWLASPVSSPTRVWLHTDTWDHPAAMRTYQRAGFQIYEVRDQPAGPL
jgi:GNAT superfamily N-acetyltransferase